MSIRDIAKKAGVSKSTVSRVLNHHPYVSDDKKKRVLQVMKEMDYTPNQQAINLSKGKSNIIGLMVPYSSNSCYSQLIEGVLEQATKLEKHVMMMPTYFDEDKEKNYYTFLRDKTVDGIIVSSRTQDSDFLNTLRPYGPIVTTEKTTSHHIPSVYPDREKLYHQVFDYLKKTNKEVYLTTQRTPETSQSSRLKKRLYQMYFPNKVLENHFIEGIKDYDTGYEAGLKLFKEINQPSVIYVNGDDNGAGLVAAGKQLGKELHQDYELIGEDNLPYSELLGFDSVDFQMKDIGRQAVSLLLSEEKVQRAVTGQIIRHHKK